MIKANVLDVKTRLSEYLDRAAAGEHIVICRHNKPVAELRPIETARTTPRPVGPLPGRPTFDVPATFFDPMSEEELRLWEGLTNTDPLSSWTPDPRRETSRIAETRATYAPKTTKPGGRASTRARHGKRRP